MNSNLVTNIINYTKVNSNMIQFANLAQLYQKLEAEYHLYRCGTISQEEYLKRIKPVDLAITQLEMSTLQDTFAWKEASLQHTQKQVD